jgi:glutamine amidotransferase
MKVVIIDYGAGNIRSVQFAFRRLGLEPEVSNDAELISAADRVVFPGVGQASSALSKLQATGLDRLLPDLKQPVLGICLGMQLMCHHTEENMTPGLGIFDCVVRKFPDIEKVPQIGWNEVQQLKGPLFKGIREKEYMYLVHSYYAEKCADTVAYCQYGLKYSAALSKDNFFGVQFHPEKSSDAGEKLLQNFLNL